MASVQDPQALLEQLQRSITAEDRPELTQADLLLAWSTPEYREITMNRRQLLIAASVAGILLILALITANFLFAIVIALASVAGYLFVGRPPRTMNIVVTTKGIAYGDRFFVWNQDAKRFWVLYDPPLATLNIATRSLTDPTLEIQLGDQDPFRVRDTLLQYLEEDPRAEESFADSISRKIGF